MHIEWRPCVGFPGYEVSNIGQIKSVFWSKKNLTASRVLSPHPNSNGYPSVSLKMWGEPAGRFKHILIHRLVCEAFHGPRPEGLVTRHLDGNKNHNHEQNLMWGTHAENRADAIAHGTAFLITDFTPEQEQHRVQKLRESAAERRRNGIKKDMSAARAGIIDWRLRNPNRVIEILVDARSRKNV